MKDIKFDFNDITIIPAAMSYINSRSEIDIEYNPIIVSPMDTVVSKDNMLDFIDQKMTVCLPRNEECVKGYEDVVFLSYGLDEIILLLDNKIKLNKKILIDVANGNMRRVYDTAIRIKNEHPEVILMVGNIANPETYRLYCEIGVDYVRCSVGSGQACLTSVQTSVHFPIASLIKECYDISCTFANPSKIVADGGFKSYKDIITALALGADYVMLGSILNKAVESCSKKYIKDEKAVRLNMIEVDNQKAKELLKDGVEIYTDYRGMSTKEVQKKWGRKTLKTAEGISKLNKVEYTLSGWSENFNDYLRSTMSYCDKLSLESFKGNVEYVFITEQALLRFKK